MHIVLKMNFQEARELALKTTGSKIKSSGDGSFTVVANDGEIVTLPNLPSEEESKANDIIKQKLKNLEDNPPSCYSCRSIIQLIKNKKGEYFWACKNYSLPKGDSKKCNITHELSAMAKAKISHPQPAPINTTFPRLYVQTKINKSTKNIHSSVDEDLKMRMNKRYNRSNNPLLPSGPNLDRMQKEKEAMERSVAENGPKPKPFPTSPKELSKLKDKGPTSYTVDDGLAGSREDNNKAKGRQWGEMFNRGRK